MNGQFRFDFEDALNKGHRAILKAIDDAVDGCGGNAIAADIIGTDTGTLTKTLDNHPERPMRTRWALGIGMRTKHPQRAALAAALVLPLGFGVIDLAPPTADDYEAELELLGPVGAMVRERVMARRRGAL